MVNVEVLNLLKICFLKLPKCCWVNQAVVTCLQAARLWYFIVLKVLTEVAKVSNPQIQLPDNFFIGVFTACATIMLHVRPYTLIYKYTYHKSRICTPLIVSRLLRLLANNILSTCREEKRHN